MSTRSAARRASLTPTFPTTHALAIPDDLWLEIFARLPPSDLPSALAAAPDFARLAPFAWRGLALHRWPAWCSVAQAAGVPIRDWRRQAEFFELRDREEAAVAACSRPARESTGEAAVASPIGPRHRAILVEWLAEVAFEWGTESTVVFKAAAYLDAYLTSQQVEDLSQFQLLGIAALRAAMADAAARAESTAAATAASAQPAHGPTPAASGESDASATTSSSDTAASAAGPHAARPRAGRGGRRAPPTARAAPSGLESEAAKEEGGDAKPTTSTAAGPAAAPAAPAAPAPEADDPLDPARFAHVAARTYSPAAVEAATASVVAAAPPALACAPNAKMFLRAFWYRALAAGGVVAGGGEAMHVYTLASFFLALALLDAAWPATPASLAAAGALSLALEVCGEAAVGGCPWPAALQAASGHAPAAVAAQRAALRSVQASTQAPHLRRVWAAHHAGHGYAEFKGQWDGVLGVMAEAGEV